MSKETQSIISSLQETLDGQPWFGRGVFAILNEIDESKIYEKPNADSHSLAELLWHMNTWAEFTLGALENWSVDEMKRIEEIDWRTIDPNTHNWKNGLKELRSIHIKIIDTLKKKTDDNYLDEIVPDRKYNYRYMLNGLVQHNIYHLGQIAYIKKMLN